MAEKHILMGGKLHVYKRDNSQYWQCSAYFAGRNWRTSTKEDSLSHAKEIAEDWYLVLRGKARSGELKQGKTFKQAAKKFLEEYHVMTAGERNEEYVASKEQKLRLYLLPFFGNKYLSDITSGLAHEYRIKRMQDTEKTGKPPARSTLHSEIVALRQVLKTAARHGWIQAVPDLSAPYKSSGKISHRGWFSPEEYKKLYEATRSRAQIPPKPRWKWACEQLHDYVLFMANTGLRPDEVKRLEFRDVAVVDDYDSEETILEIEVRGKRGIGYCKSTTGAVRPFERLAARLRPVVEEGVDGYRQTGRNHKEMCKPEATDLIFPTSPRELLNAVLNETQLKVDRDGNTRTAYSLRHTYICFHLMEGADIYQIAKNCRTSVEMIEKYYASHIRTNLDASAINVKKVRRKKIT
ncbi:MAG: integrase [Alphaproteobacteria bacterium]|nr:MAG: integrase [Alphaproteobacteria bacterium]